MIRKVLRSMLKFSQMKIHLTTIIAILFLSSCSFLEAKRPPIAEPGSVLFSETFSWEKQVWRTWNQEGSFVGYQADGFRFYIDQANTDFFSTPGFNYQDVLIDVDAIKTSGPDENIYGLICRMQDEENYYAFIISSDGYTGIIKVQDGVYRLLNNPSLEFSSAIVQGKALNQLTVICQGNTLGLDINGTRQFRIKDDTFAFGDIGLIAGTMEEAGVDIFFDNLTVIQP